MTLRKWINGNYTQPPSDRFLQIAKEEVTKWYTKSKTSADISDAMTRIETTLRGLFREIIVLYGTPYK